MEEQPKTYRVMDGGEWAWLLICTYLRAFYLLYGWWAVAVALVLGAIPLLNIGVFVWAVVATHKVYGCRTTAIAMGIWACITVPFLIIAYAL